MSNWTDKYIGLPFLAKGRTMAGVDCAGLCILVLQQECGIKAWDCTELYMREEMHTRAGLKRLDSLLRKQLRVLKPVPVEEIRPFDVVVYRHHGVESHCAICIDSKHVLNIYEKHTAHIAPVNLPGFAIAGVYRHE